MDSLVIGCIDFRFSVKKRHALRELFKIFDLDMVSVPGGAYALCRPRSWNPFRWILWLAYLMVIHHALKIGINKHQVSHVVLSTHEDCGMIAQDGYLFERAKCQKECAFHEARLREARDRISRWFPEIRISLALVHADHEGKIQMDPIEEIDRVQQAS